MRSLYFEVTVMADFHARSIRERRSHAKELTERINLLLQANAHDMDSAQLSPEPKHTRVLVTPED